MSGPTIGLCKLKPHSPGQTLTVEFFDKVFPVCIAKFIETLFDDSKKGEVAEWSNKALMCKALMCLGSSFLSYRPHTDLLRISTKRNFECAQSLSGRFSH